MTPSPHINPEPAPEDRLRDPASRNVIFGWVSVLIVLLVLAADIVLAGPGLSLVALVSAMVVLGVLWLLWRLGLPQQPSGLFLSAGITAFAALLVPLAVGVLLSAQRTQQMMMAGAAAAPPAARSSSTPPAPELPLLEDEYSVERPDPDKDDYVEILQDSKIRIDGKYYRIRGGERFVLDHVSDREVVFKTRDFLISLPAGAVTVHQVAKPGMRAAAAAARTPESAPSTEAAPAPGEQKPASVLAQTRAAQERAIEKYPALSIKDSRENRTYVEAYMQLKQSNPGFFEDPEWPYQLAEALAERDGWKTEGAAEEEPASEATPEPVTESTPQPQL